MQFRVDEYCPTPSLSGCPDNILPPQRSGSPHSVWWGGCHIISGLGSGSELASVLGSIPPTLGTLNIRGDFLEEV